VIRVVAKAALAALADELKELYSPTGRGSLPPELPERLMRALLLQAFHSIR
jgi:hypothetical protein